MKPIFNDIQLKIADMVMPSGSSNTWSTKLYKNKLRYEMKSEYGWVVDFDPIFDSFWDANNLTYVDRRAVQLGIKLCFDFIKNNSVRTLVGVQSMTGPVGVVQTTHSGSNVVEALCMRLSIRWGLESQQDFSIVHDIDIRDEFIGSILSMLDREFINEFRSDISTGSKHYAITLGVDFSNPTVLRNARMDLTDKINEVADDIWSRVGERGNVVWVSPIQLSLLQSSPNSTFIQGETNVLSTINMVQAGTLCDPENPFNDIIVYCDTHAGVEESIIVGYKGDDVESGIFLLPYVPIMYAGVIPSSEHEPEMSFKSRYAKYSGVDDIGFEYYGIIDVTMDRSKLLLEEVR